MPKLEKRNVTYLQRCDVKQTPIGRYLIPQQVIGARFPRTRLRGRRPSRLARQPQQRVQHVFKRRGARGGSC